MRPRLITAENEAAVADAAAAREASMRPRLITAENLPDRAAAACAVLLQ